VERHCGNPHWENIVPNGPLVRVLIKNEISDEGAKYEHTSKDIEKTENPTAHEIVSRAEWLRCMTQRRREGTRHENFRATLPSHRESNRFGDCAHVTAEVSGVSRRLSDDGNRNQYFSCGGRESASVPRCRVR